MSTALDEMLMAIVIGPTAS